jgi:DNA-binding SARP family transcriptional activator
MQTVLNDISAPSPVSGGRHDRRAVLPRPRREAAVGLEIYLFGGLRLRRDGTTLTPLLGAPATLLRMVSTYGALHVDELGEAMWPDAREGAGRARLRNVLSRVRASCGEAVVRVGETVAIADGVDVDLARFEAAARRAVALPLQDPAREAFASRAMALACGELLPEDIYREWAAVPRERVRRYRLDLLDLLAAAALARGDISRAVRRWQEAFDIEPYDEDRYVAAAGLLADAGRWGAAHSIVRRAEVSLAEAGLPPSPPFLGLRHRLSSPREGGATG